MESTLISNVDNDDIITALHNTFKYVYESIIHAVVRTNNVKHMLIPVREVLYNDIYILWYEWKTAAHNYSMQVDISKTN